VTTGLGQLSGLPPSQNGPDQLRGRAGLQPTRKLSQTGAVALTYQPAPGTRQSPEMRLGLRVVAAGDVPGVSGVGGRGPGGTMEVPALAIFCREGPRPADDIFAYPGCPEPVPS
jgi:hypothetical protein